MTCVVCLGSRGLTHMCVGGVVHSTISRYKTSRQSITLNNACRFSRGSDVVVRAGAEDANLANLITWKATGVPVLNQLRNQPTFWDANMLGFQLIGVTLILSLVFKYIIDGSVARNIPMEEEGIDAFDPVRMVQVCCSSATFNPRFNP
jgi:hypothetical protein